MIGAAEAVARGDGPALAPLTEGAPESVFAWLDWSTPAEPGKPPVFRGRRWQAGVLRVPGAPGARVAVFWGQHSVQSTSDHVHRLVRRGDTWKIGPEWPEAETFGFRIRYHQLTVDLDPAHQASRFTDRLRVRRARPDARTLQFRLSAIFGVDSVTSAGAEVPFAQVGGVVYAAPPPGDELELEVKYHGFALPPDRFSGNLFSPTEAVLTAYWYPSLARLPATNTVAVRVPRDWSAISQGELVSRREEGEGVRFTYRMDVPNCFFTLAAAPFHAYERSFGDHTYRVWLETADEARARAQLGLMDDSFRYFERVWGPYPYRSYTIVERAPFGFALESYTFATYDRGGLPNPNPHEWAHTWWGGFVPCTYLQDAWNEAFATYATSVYFRRGATGPAPAPERDAVYWRRATPGLERAVARLPLSRCTDTESGEANAVAYAKGGLVMQELERVLGYETLMRCMRAFRESTPRGEAATWTDFERVAAKTAGRDLKGWFDQWVRRPGLPRLRWENVRRAGGPKGWSVEADLVQEGEPYRLDVPVRLVLEDGKAQESVQAIHGAVTHLRLKASARPLRLVLDPRFRAARAVSPEESPWLSARGRGQAITIGPAGGGRFSARTPDQVTDAELRESNLVLIGGPAQNAVWARLAASCPFEVTPDAVVYKGRRVPGGRATAVTRSPLNPDRWITWRAGGGAGFDPPSAPVVVFNAAGELVGGEGPEVEGGPGSYAFPP